MHMRHLYPQRKTSARACCSGKTGLVLALLSWSQLGACLICEAFWELTCCSEFILLVWTVLEFNDDDFVTEHDTLPLSNNLEHYSRKYKTCVPGASSTMKVWASTSLSLEKCPKHQGLHIWGGNGLHLSWAVAHLRKEGPRHEQRGAQWAVFFLRAGLWLPL